MKSRMNRSSVKEICRKPFVIVTAVVFLIVCFTMRKKLVEIWSELSEEYRGWNGDDLTSAIHRRISSIQNPINCAAARLLFCKCDEICGLACTLDCWGRCLYVSLGTNRTMVPHTSAIFLYYSKPHEASPATFSDHSLRDLRRAYGGRCKFDDRSQKHPAVEWQGSGATELTTDRIVTMSANSGKVDNKTLYKPGSVPHMLLPHLRQRNITQPSVWWAGQVISYLLRPPRQFGKYLKKIRETYTNSVVGLYLPSSDVVNADQYMAYVMDVFTERMPGSLAKDGKPQFNYVFLASDDPSVADLLRKRYADFGYVFLYKPWIEKEEESSWLHKTLKYEPSDFTNILTDIHLLHTADHLVCKYSSKVCELMYQLRQTRKEGARRDSIIGIVERGITGWAAPYAAFDNF